MFSILKPIAVSNIIQVLLKTVFGKQFVTPNIINLDETLSTSCDQNTPLFVSTAPGFDPSSTIAASAQKLKRQLKIIAIGSKESITLANKALSKAM